MFEFTTLDVIMGFNAPDFALRTNILSGSVSRLSFTPNLVGRFPFFCDVFCGNGHEEMSGIIVVTS
jgi:cytochrome c oxidase subunit II